jgi:hypothetical protein
MRMSDGEGQQLAMDSAQLDLELALKVAPDYVLPRLRLAEVAYACDANEHAARLFAATVERIESTLCSGVSGQVEALADAGQRAEAEVVLARWLVVFPNSERLRAALAHVGLGRTHS